MCNFVSGIIMHKTYDSYRKGQVLVYNGMSHSDTCKHFGIPYDSSDLVREWEWTHKDGLIVRGDDDGRLKKLIEKKYQSFDQLIKSVDNQIFRNNALQMAAEHGYLDDVKYLVEHGADVHANYDLAIRLAAREGHFDVVKYLVEHGANIHAISDYPLQLAVANGHLDVVIYLIENGADIHENYDCVLRLAVKHGHTDVVEYLKECIKKRGSKCVIL